MNIFISHSSKDAVYAAKLCEFLELRKNTCFLAPRDIRPGYEYAEEIMGGIDRSDIMLVLMTKEANDSPHVSREIERAVSRNLHIITCKLEEVSLNKSMEYYLMARQWVDLTQGADQFTPVLSAIDEFCEKEEIAKSDIKKDVPQENKNTNEGTEKEKNKNGLILAVMLGVLACVMIVSGVSIYFLFNSDKKVDSDDITLNSEVENSNPENDETGNGETTNDEQNIENSVDYAKMNLGDRVTFGTYNNEPIEWRVVHLDEEGKSAFLVTSDIITMKAFDAAEGGTYAEYGEESYWAGNDNLDDDLDKQILVFGNSDWSQSNIRAWLNAETEVVHYPDQAPSVSAMSEGDNAYDRESGFLYGFSEEERAAILESEVKTKGNALKPGEEIITNDKVFLLSKEELNYLDEAGMSRYAVPTQAAVDQDESNWYEMYCETYNRKEISYWLRDPEEARADKCYLVSGADDNTQEYILFVGLEGYGIRPAICVDLSSKCFMQYNANN